MPRDIWRTSTRCASGTCVGVSFAVDGVVRVRDTSFTDGPIISVPAESWRALVSRVQAGDFDRA